MRDGKLSCNCHLFPDLKKRGGHLFVPSWEYCGPYAGTVQCTMASKIHGRVTEEDMDDAINTFWLRYLPDALRPYVDAPPLLGSKANKVVNRDLTEKQVRLCKRALCGLVVVPIDKCTSRVLLVCPHYFEQMYDETYNVYADDSPYEFTGVGEAETLQGMMDEYFENKWDVYADWDADGMLPVPYILPKLKDILANPDVVMESKGVYCRCRPIIPFTRHPMRTFYRRCGKGLKLCLDTMPADNHFHVDCAAAVVDGLANVQKLADAKYLQPPGIPSVNYSWLVVTGDLSNMYTMLPHSNCDDGIHNLTDNVADWTSKRHRSMVSVYRYESKEHSARFCRGDKGLWIDIPFSVLKSACAFDNRCTFAVLKGAVIRQKAGCPMGGFLSPVKAISGCAVVEQSLLSSMYSEHPGFLHYTCRYMDDVLTAIPYSGEAELMVAEEWVSKITSGYPDPLVLEVVRDTNSQRYLELMVETMGSRLVCRLYNRVTDALNSRKYHNLRLPSLGDASHTRTVRGTIAGALARIKEGSTSHIQAAQGCRELRWETRAAGYGKLFAEVLHAKCERVVDELDGDCDSSDRSFWCIVAALM